MTRDPPHPRCGPDCETCAQPMPDPAPISPAAAHLAQRDYEAQRARYVELNPIKPVTGETAADAKARESFEREVAWRVEHPGQEYKG